MSTANNSLSDIVAAICEFDCEVLNCITIDDIILGKLLLVMLTNEFSPENDATTAAANVEKILV